MEGAFTFVLMRMFERLLSVIVGAMAIYLGYRMFVLLPTQANSAGRVDLPGYKVVLSKVGPGIFFALFGSIVLYTTLNKPIHVDDNGFSGATSIEPLHSQAVTTPQELERVRSSLQILNCIERVVPTSEKHMPADDVELAVRQAKIALIESVWKTEWGKSERFRQWAESSQGDLPISLRALYDSAMPNCPK